LQYRRAVDSLILMDFAMLWKVCPLRRILRARVVFDSVTQHNTIKGRVIMQTMAAKVMEKVII